MRRLIAEMPRAGTRKNQPAKALPGVTKIRDAIKLSQIRFYVYLSRSRAMSNSAKVALYTVLVIIASVSGYFAYQDFGRLMTRSANRNSELERIEPLREHPPQEPATNASAPLSTNSGAILTNSANLTNAEGGTNMLSRPIEPLASTASATNTNDVASMTVTNSLAMADTGTVAQAEEIPTALSPGPASGAAAGKRKGRLGLWTGLLIISVIGLGLLVANDVSHFMGNRALKVLYNDEGAGAKDADYERAEELWTNGEHLEAIRMMREYLNKHPREQHVAIRIAEIYEKDLKNDLAAALEYEEVLKHKLPDERWGWAAIHLCNLYFRLSQEQKAIDLLRRIVAEYPKVAAAEKARKRLEQIGEAPPPPPSTPIRVDARDIAAPPHPDAPSSPAPASNLPPGFRPKK
jgi:TolA-binding protein